MHNESESRAMRVIIFVVLLLLAGAAFAESEPPAWSPRQPASMTLTVDREPELCAVMLEAARGWYASDSLSIWDLHERYLPLDRLRWDEPRREGHAIHFRQDLDLDGDGKPESLHVRQRMLAYEDVYEAFVGPSDESDASDVLKIVERQPYRYANPLKVYRWRDRYYFNSLGKSAAQIESDLLRINTNAEPTLVCRAASGYPEGHVESLRRAPEIRALIRALDNISRAGADCTSQNYCRLLFRTPDEWLGRAALRPWASGRFESSEDLWSFLEGWAHSGPWTMREFTALGEAIVPARRSYARYLADSFGFSAAQSRAHADIALDIMIADRFGMPTVEQGSYFGGPNRFDKTPLMTAAHMNRLDLVRKLLAEGWVTEARTIALQDHEHSVRRANRTALMYAAENASPLLIKALLDAGADPHATDSRGDGMSHYLALNPRLTTAQREMPITEIAASVAKQRAVPGFACSRARTRTERTICGSEGLSLLDAEMTKAFTQALATGGADLKADQRRWSGWRAKDCETVDDAVYVDCLAAKTSGRERYLRYLVAE